jgi:hypothetical protein
MVAMSYTGICFTPRNNICRIVNASGHVEWREEPSANGTTDEDTKVQDKEQVEKASSSSRKQFARQSNQYQLF